MQRVARRIGYLAAAIAVVLLFGVTGLVLIEGYPVFDAFYMTLITMTTVGYSEIRPLSQAGRAFNVVTIVLGVSVMFGAIGVLTQTIIELEFGEVFARRRQKRMIDNLQDHFIICGFGRVGRGAAAELQRAGAPFVVVENNDDRVERAIQHGMLAVSADATRDETLRLAGIDRARGLVAALATDADNLYVILSAKTLNARLFVATRAAEEGAEDKMRRAGADSVFAPYVLAGHRLANACLKPHVVQFLDFTTGGLDLGVGIEQVRVAEGSSVAGRSIRDMQIRRELGVIVLAIRTREGKMLFNPAADTQVAAGDFLIAMGKPGDLQHLEAMVAVAART